MHQIFQTFIDHLEGSFDEQSLHIAMDSAAKALDLACFAYLALPRGPRDRPRLISNYPSAWTAHYLQSHYERFDPVILCTVQECEPFQWGPGLGPSNLSPPQRELFADAAVFGIRYGFTVPIHDGIGPVAAVTFASQERTSSFQRCIEQNGRVLQLMALYFHAHARRKIIVDRRVDGIRLSARELECLQWVSSGKSAWDIGVILGIKRRTVAFHLDSAKAKMGVRTLQQAVARFAASKIYRQ